MLTHVTGAGENSQQFQPADAAIANSRKLPANSPLQAVVLAPDDLSFRKVTVRYLGSEIQEKIDTLSVPLPCSLCLIF
jgi:hypothetical protein